jgi:AMP-polyphosphate phosphotransferase
MILDKLDLSKKMDKRRYKAIMPALQRKIGELQRRAREMEIPVVVVFEGWGAAGKGTQINNLMLALDPRGFNVNLTRAASEEEYMRPFLWRFWLRLPAAGRIAIFDRSWYRGVLHDRAGKAADKEEWSRTFREIRAFERQLTDNGTIIVKFFFISAKRNRKNVSKHLLKITPPPGRCRRTTGNSTGITTISRNAFRTCSTIHRAPTRHGPSSRAPTTGSPR